MAKRVIVLGASGMLGSIVADYLSQDPELEVTATTRDRESAARMGELLPAAAWQVFDASRSGAPEALALIEGQEWVVNAIGIIKPFIHDDDAREVEQAIEVNALFPHLLAERALECGARILQIATDCVYSGSKGRYVETDPHDALDVYGKTKSLGEVAAAHVHHLRCSIVGPEPGRKRSLLEWFRGQPPGAEVGGFVNHRWNGVTTLHFAKACHGVITGGKEVPAVHHLVPGDEVTKLELLELFARSFDRDDIHIAPTEAPTVVDRTLSTTQEATNRELWAAAGHAAPPSVAEMVDELARFDYRAAMALAHAS